MKKLIALSLALVMLLTCTVACAEKVVIGGVSMDFPSGWSILSQEEQGVMAIKGSEVLFIFCMDLNTLSDMESVVSLFSLLDDETVLTLLASSMGKAIEVEPVVTLPSGQPGLYCVLDMSDYAEIGALLGICPTFVTMNGDICILACVSGLGREVSEEAKADFRTITSTTTVVK